jgi:hypothetical protein
MSRDNERPDKDLKISRQIYDESVKVRRQVDD